MTRARDVSTPTALVLVKTQTIGTAVSSVTVSGAFSATFDNYKIVVNGGGSSATANLSLTLGGIVTGYFNVRHLVNVSTSSSSIVGQSTTTSWTHAGACDGNGINLNADITNPFLAIRKICNASPTATTGLTTFGWFSGFCSNETSLTDFTITPSTGTLTGGTIRVYGYQN